MCTQFFNQRGGIMDSTIIKHSVRVRGRKTSITLEPAFWDVIREAAKAKGVTVAALVSQVDRERTGGNLSSALRVFALGLFRKDLTEVEHIPAHSAAMASTVGLKNGAGLDGHGPAVAR